MHPEDIIKKSNKKIIEHIKSECADEITFVDNFLDKSNYTGGKISIKFEKLFYMGKIPMLIKYYKYKGWTNVNIHDHVKFIGWNHHSFVIELEYKK